MCWKSYFETRFHAYTGITYYQVLFVIINTGLCVWGYSIVDKNAAPPGTDCFKINVFANLAASFSMFEAITNALLVYGFLNLMQGYFAALFALIMLLIYGGLVLIKTITVVLGVVWLYGLEYEHCKNSTGDLYTKSDVYLKTCIGVVAFQYCLGSFCLLACGLHHAIDEAVAYVFPEWKPQEWLDTQQVSSFA